MKISVIFNENVGYLNIDTFSKELAQDGPSGTHVVLHQQNDRRMINIIFESAEEGEEFVESGLRYLDVSHEAFESLNSTPSEYQKAFIGHLKAFSPDKIYCAYKRKSGGPTPLFLG